MTGRWSLSTEQPALWKSFDERTAGNRGTASVESHGCGVDDEGAAYLVLAERLGALGLQGEVVAARSLLISVVSGQIASCRRPEAAARRPRAELSTHPQQVLFGANAVGSHF
jgi:hypothetical protein